MSNLMGSQGLVLATAMAVSAGTVIIFDLLREKYISTAKLELTKNIQNSPHDQKHILKSCLSSGEKNKDSRRKKKRVHFAGDVKDSKSNGEEYSNYCGKGILGMPANRRALYTGILKDRVHRIEFSY